MSPSACEPSTTFVVFVVVAMAAANVITATSLLRLIIAPSSPFVPTDVDVDVVVSVAGAPAMDYEFSALPPSSLVVDVVAVLGRAETRRPLPPNGPPLPECDSRRTTHRMPRGMESSMQTMPKLTMPKLTSP